jgi:hypothetical protein
LPTNTIDYIKIVIGKIQEKEFYSELGFWHLKCGF